MKTFSEPAPFMLEELCHRPGCDDFGLYAVRVCVPLRGSPGVAWEFQTGLILCRAHFHAEARQARRYATPTLRSVAAGEVAALAAQFQLQGDPYRELDFRRLYLAPEHCMSERFRLWRERTPRRAIARRDAVAGIR